MKRLYKSTAWTAVIFCLTVLLNGCTRDNEIVIPETSVHQASDGYSVVIGNEVIFTGENMHLISKVTFDDQAVNITTLPADRSKSSLTVAVPDNFEVTKSITVFATYNSVRKLDLSHAFEVVVPSITSDVTSAAIGNKVILTGKNMHLITKVSFGDQSITFDRNNDRSHTTLTVTVPSTFATTQIVPLKVTYTTHTVEVNNAFEVVVPPAPSLPYLFWENIELGSIGTEKAFFDVSRGRTMTPCDVVDHKEYVTFAMDNTSSIAARLLNPANISTNLLNGQSCNGTVLNLNDYADFWKKSEQVTPFKKATDTELINKVTSGQITNIRDDIGDVPESDIKTNTPTVAQDEVYYFYHNGKFGLILIKSLNINADRKLNTITMNVYYEK